jgi:CheY-like chemotaxis protein
MLRAAQAAHDPYDVAFVDVRMPPGIDGVETIARAMAISPGTEYILCSAYSDYSQDQVRQRVGAGPRLAFVAKPFEPDLIRGLVSTGKPSAAHA